MPKPRGNALWGGIATVALVFEQCVQTPIPSFDTLLVRNARAISRASLRLGKATGRPEQAGRPAIPIYLETKGISNVQRLFSNAYKFAPFSEMTFWYQEKESFLMRSSVPLPSSFLST